MNCPLHTDTPLAISERHGIEIDYCPTCRGVWLDRGELDKIIERVDRSEDDRDRDRGDADDRPRGRGPLTRPRRKRESMLSELFEFGG